MAPNRRKLNCSCLNIKILSKIEKKGVVAIIGATIVNWPTIKAWLRVKIDAPNANPAITNQ